MASLDKFDKPLTSAQVAHLLRRMTFGGSSETIKALTGKTAQTIVESYLLNTAEPAPPKDAANKTFHDLPWGIRELIILNKTKMMGPDGHL